MSTAEFTDLDEANALVDQAMTAVRALCDGAFWKLGGDDLLETARRAEQLHRSVYALQVHVAGEIDAQGLAGQRSCSSTAALLRQILIIAPAEANSRVNTARHTLDRENLLGESLPPKLPTLAAALDNGEISAEQAKIVVGAMTKIPAVILPEQREECEHHLVEQARVFDPIRLDLIARKMLDCLDPDGDLDESTAASKMELTFGNRNIKTGLTPVKGHLDDETTETLKKALDGLTAPKPASNGDKDTRPAANRAAHALAAVARGFLDAGCGPTHGGERPHVSVVIDWDAACGAIKSARFDTGGPINAAQARKWLCDAQIIPAILGSSGEILNVGQTQRAFPLKIRRAIALRDRGCIWDGCDRPAGWCDAHHIVHWEHGGETKESNGCLLCPFHHTEIHRDTWQIRMGADGLPELIPPRWIDPHQLPRRNTMHRTPTLGD